MTFGTGIAFIALLLPKVTWHLIWPFLLSTEKAVDMVISAIERKKGLVIFPWQMKWVSRLLRYLPRYLYKKLMQADLLGLRQG